MKNDDIEDLIASICESFAIIPESSQEEIAPFISRFKECFPSKMSEEFLRGVFQALSYFLSQNAPEEVRLFACIISTAYSQAVAEGRIKVQHEN